MPSLRTCERCKHFTEFTGQRAGSGLCKRFPPVLNPKFVLDATSYAAVGKIEAWCFPRVQTTDTCGEFQTRSASAVLAPRSQ